MWTVCPGDYACKKDRILKSVSTSKNFRGFLEVKRSNLLQCRRLIPFNSCKYSSARH